MSSKPSVLLRVADVKRSVEFYQEIGWPVCDIESDTGLAQVFMPNGSRALLVPDTDQALDVRLHMEESFDEPSRGKCVYFLGSNLKRFAEHCQHQRITNVSFQEGDFWSSLVITDPDGYVLSFDEELEVPDERIIAGYESGPSQLQEALMGLDEAQLDLRRAPGKWSIRETVLHLIDSDVTAAITMKFALAEPGGSFSRSSYDPDKWAEGADYAHRPIHVEVQLFSLMRQHIIGMCHLLPGALDRAVVRESGEIVSVRFLLKLLAGHAKGHIDQVVETRQVHNI